MVRQSVLCEVNQYVFRNYCQYSPVACSLLTLQPVCQLSDCCLTCLQCVWLYSFSRQISCCCQAFAIQVCYCLLAELRCDGAIDGSCTQAGVQLGEATCMQAWGACSVCIMSWHGAVILQMQVACLMCVVSPFLQILPVNHGLQLPLLVAVVVLAGLDEIC